MREMKGVEASVAVAPSPGEAPPLGRATRIAYGSGAIANGVKNVAFTAYLMFFYNQVVGAPAAMVSAAIALTLVVDAVFDPVLGRWSDSVRTRWGAAIPSSTDPRCRPHSASRWYGFPPRALTVRH